MKLRNKRRIKVESVKNRKKIAEKIVSFYFLIFVLVSFESTVSCVRCMD